MYLKHSKMKINLAFLFSVCLLFSFTENEVDAVSEKFYKDIEARYLQSSSVLSYSYHVNQFDTTGMILLKSMSGLINQSKSKYSYDLNDVKVAFEDSFYLVVYPNKKEMYYHILTNKLMEENQNLDVRKFVEQLRKNNVRVQIDSSCMNSKTHACYNLVHGRLSKDLYKIRIDKKTGYIDNIRIDYYGSSDKNTIDNYVMEIKYSDYKLLDSKNFFPLKEYVVKTNGELMKNEKYKDFDIKKF
jgi:hypothetical protein